MLARPAAREVRRGGAAALHAAAARAAVAVAGRRPPLPRPPPAAATPNDFLGDADAPAASVTVQLPGRTLTGPANLPLGMVAQTLTLPPWPRLERQVDDALPPPLPPITLILPADVDAVMDAYLAAGCGDADPYWARPWPAGLALAAALLGGEGSVHGRSVLDLGAGAGVAGIAAAAAGAGVVCLTDRDPWALECASASAGATLGEEKAGAVVSTRPLDWSDEEAVAAAAAAAPGGKGWEVVLATDVLYDAHAAEPVAAALGALLTPGGLALVADPARRAPGHRAAFAAAVAALRPPLVLESWTAVSPAGELAVPDATGTTLVLALRSRVGGRGTIGAPRWP